MAGIITPQFGFRNAAVDHSPSPLSFGFGLTSAAAVPGWQPPGMHTSSLSPAPSTIGNSSKSAQKRKVEDPDEDEAMDRSPTPEKRPIRPMRQRARSERFPKGHYGSDKESLSDTPGGQPDSDVDVGMLLASLPPQSLLPILTSLVSTHPTLKPTILSLIPRPTLDTALSAVNRSAKKLSEAYPYSNGNGAATFSLNSASRHNQQSQLSSAATNAMSGFGHSRQPETQQSGMRDVYILSRLRPHINDFVSTAFSYMPYFSLVSESSAEHNPLLQRDSKIYAHPSETFTYLSALTNHLLNQPPLSQSALAPLLLPRLVKEWMAWVNRIDVHLRGGNMIGSNMAESWVSALDRYAECRIESVEGNNASFVLKPIRDRWIAVAGFLVGRSVPFG